MRVLITGITGMVGSHLAEYILADHPSVEVHGLIRWRSPLDNIRQILPQVHLHYAELRDLNSLIVLLNKVKPDKIFHLAAQSFVTTSFDAPADTLHTNVIGTTNLLDAVRITGIDPTIHICSSSEVYGQVTADELPIKENNPFRPASPYAVSKTGEDMISLQYFLSYGIKTIRTRMFTHSVSKWTPVILRDPRNGLIDIKYISEIRSPQKKGGYLSGKILEDGTQIWDLGRSNLEIWNDGDWTALKHISCHPLNGHKLLEVACRSGVVDVTDNHSIINEQGQAVEAGQLKIGDKVKITKLPRVELTCMPEGLAWVYGFFVAEGCVTGSSVRFDNQNLDKLERTKVALLKYLGVDSQINPGEEGMYRLSVRQPIKLAQRFREDCYASDKNKKIPKLILNADRETKLEFLRGYNAGDGDEHNNVNSEFYRFKTKSPILATGLCCLIETVLDTKYRIHVEHRGDRRYYEIRCCSQIDTKNGEWLLKGDNDITKITELDYTEEVWDFETENHWFHAGVGGNVVHNTGPRRGDGFAESAFAKQIAEIEAGIKTDSVKVGNLDSVRTFADVRDAVKAYWLLLEKCTPGDVYNIGGDRTMTIGDMLEMMKGMAICPIHHEINPALLRPSDVTLQIPDISKFQQATGWKPEISLEQTFQDLLNYHRNKIKKS